MATLRTILLDAVAQSPSNIFVRWKSSGKWNSWTYSEFYHRVRLVSEAANTLGIKPGYRVGLIMENRPEWMSTYLGLVSVGVEVVPIDVRLRAGEVSYILRDSEAYAVFGSGKAWTTLQEIIGGTSKLSHIVVLDNVVEKPYKENHCHFHDYTQLMDSVLEKADVPDSYFDRCVPVESDIASIIYTSGTTGRPKGAMLMHSNFMAQLDGALQYFHVKSTDNFLLVLPLHHAFAFTANFIVPLYCQCEVSMVENLRTVAENMRETSPTILLAVPLLAEKMLSSIMSKLKKNKVATLMLKLGLGRVVGKKVIQGLGGRLRILICGGAASDVQMLKYYTKFGIKALEGYGLTETSPICALAPEEKVKFGTVGKSLPNCELRIANPNEEGIGEIQVRGPIVMKGYFRNEDATIDVFDEDWFMTGDLGKMDDEGYVTITGRKKSLIVNREGKNIYPEEVELAINESPYILESIVVGYHEENEKGERVGAIVVPNMDYIAEQRGKNEVPLTDDEIRKLCRNETHKMVEKISDYKRPRKLQIRFEPLEKTTTMKVKRYLYSLDSEEV